MKQLILACAFLASVFAGEPNTLTAQEQKAGWKLLFDGKTGANWTGAGKETFPDKGWRIESGELRKVAGERGGDLRSAGRYREFDLRWEWKISPKGNNGVKYFNTPERGGIGHEYQMLDDLSEPENARNNIHSTASFYEVVAPFENKVAALKPAGEWNASRVLVQGKKVEHWLNGQKVLEYELGSEQVKNGVAKSKFRDVTNFGEGLKGHLLLTDHNDGASFRSIKILDLSKD